MSKIHATERRIFLKKATRAQGNTDEEVQPARGNIVELKKVPAKEAA